MIRLYRQGDHDDVLDVWYAASLVAHPFLDEAFLTQERRNITDIYLPTVETWVYQQDDHVVGFISMIENEIGGLFVNPSTQRCGTGRELMDHVREPRSHLEVEVFKANEIGRAFYKKYGFKFVQESVFERTGDTVLRLRCD